MLDRIELTPIPSETVGVPKTTNKKRLLLCSITGIVLFAAAIIIPASIVLTKDKDETITTETSTVEGGSYQTISDTTTTGTPMTISTNLTTITVPPATECINQKWQFLSSCLSEWLFDESLSDEEKNYNATAINNISFISNGYINEAIQFSSNANAMLIAPYIPLSSSSFTVDCWILITALLDIYDHGIFSLCQDILPYECLHLTIRKTGSIYHLYFGFFQADCEGITSLTLNNWMHIAFVFDLTTVTQYIYLNGILENSCSVTSSITVTSANINIGYIPILNTNNGMTYFQGYIDQMTVSNRAKSSCEILQMATLVAYFTFDNGVFLIDSGPNSLQAITQSTLAISSGRYLQAIRFNGTTSSFFQISGLTALGLSNQDFSISLWIKPFYLQGILVFISSNNSSPQWSLPFLVFNTNGLLTAQISNNDEIISISDSQHSILTYQWSLIVQTWSTTNGLRLYINNLLQESRVDLATTYIASGMSNFLTLANDLTGSPTDQSGISKSYQGDMDDFRVYSRELSQSEINDLYNN